MLSIKNIGADMTKKIFLLIAGTVFVLLNFSFVFADSKANEKTLIRVHLAVSADPLTQNHLHGLLMREFKKFDDIALVEGDADWKLDIIASKTPARGSFDQDYAFSVVVLRPLGESRYAMEGHELMVGFPNLQSGSRNIVSLFAKKYLHKETKEIIYHGYKQLGDDT